MQFIGGLVLQAIQQYQQLKELLIAWHQLGLLDPISVDGLIHYSKYSSVQFSELGAIVKQICFRRGNYDSQLLYDFLCACAEFPVEGYSLQSIFHHKKIYWKVAHFKEDLGTLSKMNQVTYELPTTSRTSKEAT